MRLAVTEVKTSRISKKEAMQLLNSIGDSIDVNSFDSQRKIIQLIQKIIVLDSVNEFDIYWNF